MEIKKNLLVIKNQLPPHVQLIAVSKTKPADLIMEAYNAGQLDFGENKAQEMAEKYQNLPKDIRWHFIGHLQSNKIKFISPFVSLIHSVDSAKLLISINKEAIKVNRVIDCLLQFYIAKEETKYGFEIDEAKEFLLSDSFKELKNIRITGIMGMATYTDNIILIRNEFRHLYEYYNILKNEFFSQVEDFKEISMGMSGDYKIAIDEGSTMIRVGSNIFGNRIYKI